MAYRRGAARRLGRERPGDPARGLAAARRDGRSDASPRSCARSGRTSSIRTRRRRERSREPRRSSPASARPPIVVHTFHGHVLKGYFGPGRTAFFRQVERSLARSSDVLVAVSPEVRDELVAHGIAPTEKFTVIRLGIPLEERLGDETADLDYRHLYGIPADAFVVGWVGRMTGVKDTGAVLEIVRASARARRRRGALHGRRRPRPRTARAARARPRDRPLDLLRRLPGGRRAATTASSTRSSCRP